MEVNVSPALKSSSQLDYNIKEGMVTDLMNLVGIKLSSFFECRDAERKKIKQFPIYQAKVQEPLHSRCKSASARDGTISFLKGLKKSELQVLQVAEDEINRRGNFEPIFPSKDAQSYSFLHPSSSDVLLRSWFRVRDVEKLVEFSNLIKPVGTTGSKLMSRAPPIPIKRLSTIPGAQIRKPESLSIATLKSILPPATTSRMTFSASNIKISDKVQKPAIQFEKLRI